MLQILNYALCEKYYPEDLCVLIDKKIQLLQQSLEPPGENVPEAASIKVRAAVILEMLKEMQLGVAHNDLTKICKLIAFLTGNSYKSIYNEVQKGVHFSSFHSKQIDEVNKILEELNASISIDKGGRY